MRSKLGYTTALNEHGKARELEDRIRRYSLVVLAGVMLAAACNSTTKPTDANFRRAIDQYLAKHGKACAWLGRPFPIDIPDSESSAQSGSGFQMAVLEDAGLVHSIAAVATAPAILGRPVTHHVKRYEPTDAGNRYLQQAPGIFGQSAGFCYGRRAVDSIVKWTEPMAMGGYSQTEVTYTYKVVDTASWAARPDVQDAFGDIRTTLNGVSKETQDVGLQLTNQGWEVP